MKKLASILTLSLIAAGCTPEVGSAKWCEKMKEKTKVEWTVVEAKDFTQHCIF